MKARHPAPRASASPTPPPRSRLAIAIPILICCAAALLLARSAWPMLRPARSVVVAQAIPVHDQAAPQATPSTPDTRGSQGARRVQAAGWLEAEPYAFPCVALADGVIESVAVLEGDRVEAGQVVASLVARDSELRLRRAEAALTTANARHALAEAELRAATLSWDHPIERERAIQAATAALKESQAELDQLPAVLQSARATLARLEEESARVQISRSGNAATELELINAQQRVIAQRAELAALEGRGPVLSARIERDRAELRAAERTLELRIEDRLRLDAATADVARTGGEAESAAATRDEAALELERMTIRSPISGFVQRRLRGPGDKVVRMMDDPTSSHVLQVYDPARLQVRVDVPLADAGLIVVGQRCQIVVEVLPSRTFNGEVLRVTHEADLQKNTLEVKVAVRDPSPLLRPEMLARVTFLSGPAPTSKPTTNPSANPAKDPASDSGAEHERVTIPRAFLDEASTGPRVWIVRGRSNGRGTLHPVDVEALDSQDGWITISGPVHPGSLIAQASTGLTRGQVVKFRAADTTEIDP